MIKATAPGKIILFGEHAVVYDKLGIATAIDLRVQSQIEKSQNIVVENIGTFKTVPEELEKLNSKISDLIEKKEFSLLTNMLKNDNNLCVKYLISEILKKTKPKPFHLINKSALRKGMGGSAAIFASTAKALSEFFGLNLSKKEISNIAYKGDIIAHAGTPSGIDNSTVTYGGYVEFKKSIGPKHLDIKTKLPVVIGDTRKPASTGQTVSMVRGFVEKGDKKIIKTIDEIEEISTSAVDAIKSGNLEKLGALMDENQEKLRILQVSSPELEKLIKAALSAGAYGAKLSGGGGGGIMYALCNEKNQQKIANAINKAGGEAIITQVGAEGVRIEK